MQHDKNINYSKRDRKRAHREKTPQQIKCNMKKVQHKKTEHENSAIGKRINRVKKIKK